MNRTDNCLITTPYTNEIIQYGDAWNYRDKIKYPLPNGTIRPDVFIEVQRKWLKDMKYNICLDCERMKCIYVFEYQLKGYCDRNFNKDNVYGKN